MNTKREQPCDYCKRDTSHELVVTRQATSIPGQKSYLVGWWCLQCEHYGNKWEGDRWVRGMVKHSQLRAAGIDIESLRVVKDYDTGIVERPENTGIPTTYAGVKFRSRLEARWAAMFDLCAWSWTYEPIDLDGYIPDFILHLKTSVAVEVKPLLWDGSSLDEERRLDAADKIDRSGWNGEALIVGARVVTATKGLWTLGYMKSRCGWSHAFTYECVTCHLRTFGPGGPCVDGDWDWKCRASGCDDPLLTTGAIARWNAEAELREAGNRVQWRAP